MKYKLCVDGLPFPIYIDGHQSFFFPKFIANRKRLINFVAEDLNYTIMNTIKTRLFVVLWGVLIPFLAANCSDKKTVEKAETAETTTKTESVITVAAPPFQKFVVVSVDEEALYKKADTNSPTLVCWIESDCESDYCESIYQWSDQPGKQGFELSTDIIACAGKIFPVLGEEGNFYKVSTTTRWCEIESAYIPKASVGDIECAPITADMLEADDNYLQCRVVKDGKYKDIVLIEEYNELDGETIQVGVLKDGVVAAPLIYNMEGYMFDNQKEDIIVDDSEDIITIKYKKNLALPAEEGGDPYQLDLKKLSTEQMANILDKVTKRKPEYVEFMYHFPAQGLESFIYLVK